MRKRGARFAEYLGYVPVARTHHTRDFGDQAAQLAGSAGTLLDHMAQVPIYLVLFLLEDVPAGPPPHGEEKMISEP